MRLVDEASGRLMLALYAIPIGFVVFYTLVMMRTAWREAISLGMDVKKLRKLVGSSAAISVIPSLSIMLMYLILSQQVGKYFAWIRVLIIGSESYELRIRSYWDWIYHSWSDVAVAGFVILTLSHIIGISTAPLASALITRPLDKAIKNAKTRGSEFTKYLTAALFGGMLSRMVAPYILNVSRAPLAFVAVVSGMFMSFVTGRVGRNTPWVKTYSFSISLLFSMGMCIVMAQLGIVR